MSEEKKELSIEELNNDDKRELTQEELEQVSGGVGLKKVKDVLIAGAIATLAPTVME